MADIESFIKIIFIMGIIFVGVVTHLSYKILTERNIERNQIMYHTIKHTFLNIPDSLIHNLDGNKKNQSL